MRARTASSQGNCQRICRHRRQILTENFNLCQISLRVDCDCLAIDSLAIQESSVRAFTNLAGLVD